MVAVGVMTIHSGTAAGLDHLVKLFGADMQSWLQRVVGQTKPARVIICMSSLSVCLSVCLSHSFFHSFFL